MKSVHVYRCKARGRDGAWIGVSLLEQGQPRLTSSIPAAICNRVIDVEWSVTGLHRMGGLRLWRQPSLTSLKLQVEGLLSLQIIHCYETLEGKGNIWWIKKADGRKQVESRPDIGQTRIQTLVRDDIVKVISDRGRKARVFTRQGRVQNSVIARLSGQQRNKGLIMIQTGHVGMFLSMAIKIPFQVIQREDVSILLSGTTARKLLTFRKRRAADESMTLPGASKIVRTRLDERKCDDTACLKPSKRIDRVDRRWYHIRQERRMGQSFMYCYDRNAENRWEQDYCAGSRSRHKPESTIDSKNRNGTV